MQTRIMTSLSSKICNGEEMDSGGLLIKSTNANSEHRPNLSKVEKVHRLTTRTRRDGWIL
jgi:hypothetical protein